MEGLERWDKIQSTDKIIKKKYSLEWWLFTYVYDSLPKNSSEKLIYVLFLPLSIIPAITLRTMVASVSNKTYKEFINSKDNYSLASAMIVQLFVTLLSVPVSDGISKSFHLANEDRTETQLMLGVSLHIGFIIFFILIRYIRSVIGKYKKDIEWEEE